MTGVVVFGLAATQARTTNASCAASLLRVPDAVWGVLGDEGSQQCG